MPLAIANWNILYETARPSDASRFDKSNKPTMEEKKAATAALAFFCYRDDTSPSDPEDLIPPGQRQKVMQIIGGRGHAYYRGGSNASVRMGLVKNNIQSLSERAHVVCLQEVTTQMAQELQKTFQATHKVFFSYQTNNNHGVMILVKKEIEVISDTEVQITDGKGGVRKVKVVDVRDPETQAIVRVATAHFYGHNGTAQAVDKEASDLFSRLKKLPQSCDAIVISADVNETKKARDNVPVPAVHYANTDGGAGWQLNLIERGVTSNVQVQPKPVQFSLCAIMMDENHPSQPLHVSDLPKGLSDHAPIATQIDVQKVHQTMIKGPGNGKPPVGPTSPFQWLAALCSGIWHQMTSVLSRVWQRISSLFA